ncbi:UPF0583 protein C15orf59 homolog isoform X1 [Arapaima gigas]
MSLGGDSARDTVETPSPRETIRSHMRMVIDQLEGILQELKEVAKELREVVGQIDKLTSDFDFDLEPDDWTLATVSSTSSSERGLGDAFRLDFFNSDVLADSWDFCSFLETSTSHTAPIQKRGGRQTGDREPDQEDGHSTVVMPTPVTPFSQMNGGLPVSNGPLRITPDSSSEEASSSTHSHKASRSSGPKERVRFSDKILYHALCCDDDDEEEEDEEEEEECGQATPETDSEPSPPIASRTPVLLPADHSLHNCLDSSSSLSVPARVYMFCRKQVETAAVTQGSRSLKCIS